ncbi:MAG: hypothetical protein MI747_20540, partial [Desulfobacterales bacterium]|nr:hypothetical protein [Desulfobacterales bacterium]
MEGIKSPTIEAYGFFGDVDETISDFEKQQRQKPSSTIKISHQNSDIRLIWEPGRLQEISRRLFAKKDVSKETLNGVKVHVISWIANNHFLHGVHHMSPMECGLRIPVFFYLLKAKGIHWKDKERKSVEIALYYHTWWVSKNLALYSSLGNHTVCECIGLIFGGAVFKETAMGKRWLDKGCRFLEQELTHQILPDGGTAEQSLNYHRFVLDLYWLALDFLELNHFYDCSNWKGTLQNGEQFLSAFMFTDNRFPALGD